MIFAVIGNIRGHYPALQAALENIAQEGIQTVLHTGNCVAGHRWPNEVVDALERCHALGVQGEDDRLVVRARRKGIATSARFSEERRVMLAEAHERCTSAHIEYLRDLPKARVVTIDGVPVGVVHGTATSQVQGLREDDDENLFMRLREAVPARVVVCGRTEHPFERRVADTLFLNPGSIADADDGLARYAIVSTEEEPWTVDFRTAQFSVED